MSDDGHEHVHMWRLQGVTLEERDGAYSEYGCELCDSLLLVGPGKPHPDEA